VAALRRFTKKPLTLATCAKALAYLNRGVGE
jgi:hypothetical protein